MNDFSDPEIQILMERIEQYRSQYGENPLLSRSEIEDLYKCDENFTSFAIGPPLGGFIGWKAYAAAWHDVMSQYSRIIFRFHDNLRLFRDGDVAWMSVSTDWFGISKDEKEFRLEMRLTIIWMKDKGVWRITHEHGSCPIGI